MRYAKYALLIMLVFCLAGLAGCGSKSHPELELGGIDLGEVLDGLLTRTQRTLSGVQDMASAEAAVPELELINQDFDDLIYHVPKLSEQGQLELAGRASKALPQIRDLTQRILTMGQVGRVLGPPMETMVTKLETLGY